MLSCFDVLSQSGERIRNNDVNVLCRVSVPPVNLIIQSFFRPTRYTVQNFGTKLLFSSVDFIFLINVFSLCFAANKKPIGGSNGALLQLASFPLIKVPSNSAT